MVYHTPPKMQERKGAKKRHILDSAAKVFAVKGYYNTKIRDILDEAGISTGSFYFYFNTKEELFELLYDEMIQTYVSVLLDAVDTMTDDAGNVEASIVKVIITHWLQEDAPIDLVEFTFPLIIYNLQALGIQYNGDQLQMTRNELKMGSRQ